MKKSLSAVALVATLVGLAAVPANAAITPTLSKSTGLVQSGETITVSIPDIPAGEGVYVRLCKAPALGARPASATCYTPAGATQAGSWASLDATQMSYGAADASKPINLSVIGQFGTGANAVDCTVDSCIVFIRRDHNGGSTDFTLDANIPVTFASASDQTITPKKEARTYKKKVTRGTKQQIALLDLKTVEGNALVFKSETPKVCSLSHGSKYLSVKFKRAGTCNVTATATGTVDYKSTVFTWTYKVK